MRRFAKHSFILNSLKKTGTSFLVFIMLLMQVPDAFWQKLHTHKHHDCGLLNVIHAYTSDCTIEHRFVMPLKNEITPRLTWILNPAFYYFGIEQTRSFTSSLVKIYRNKAPPKKMA